MAIGFGSAWTACKRGRVDRIDLSTGAVTKLTTEAGSHTLLVTDDAVWVTNYLARSVSRIDPDSNEVVTTPDVGVVGITEGGGAIWVSTYDELVALDPATGKPMRRIAVPSAFWYELIWTSEGIWGTTFTPALYLIDVH